MTLTTAVWVLSILPLWNFRETCSNALVDKKNMQSLQQIGAGLLNLEPLPACDELVVLSLGKVCRAETQNKQVPHKKLYIYTQDI